MSFGALLALLGVFIGGFFCGVWVGNDARCCDKVIDTSKASKEVLSLRSAKKNNSVSCYARLIAFPHLRGAQKFVEQLDLEEKSMVIIHEHEVEGSEEPWHQVNTIIFEKEDELMRFIDKIRKKMHLSDNDILIIPCC
ncbi:MAG: hypothetical protein WBQ73_03190 [Candidatus Babeliales bacterium]